MHEMKMSSRFFRLAGVAVAVASVMILSSSCGGGGGSSGGEGETLADPVTGRWTGTAAGGGLVGDLVVDFVQSGSDVSGSYTASNPSGAVTGDIEDGRLAGSRLDALATVDQFPGCVISVSGQRQGNDRITGTLTGFDDCEGEDGTFDIRRD